MKYRIDHLKDHYILCGLGRVGEQVARELTSENTPFVVIERDESKLKTALEHNWPILNGDAALEESWFEQARIADAKAIIISVGTDADAIFMAVSARALRPDIFIVARASSLEAADKMNKIGINRVALPYQIGGYHMATMALRPAVVDFLDLLVDQDRNELEMEEFPVVSGGKYDGLTLVESDYQSGKWAVLAIRRVNGKAVIHPNGETKLIGGDRLVVMGSEKELAELKKKIEKNQPPIEEEKITDSHPHPIVADIKPAPFHKSEDSV